MIRKKEFTPGLRFRTLLSLYLTMPFLIFAMVGAFYAHSWHTALVDTPELKAPRFLMDSLDNIISGKTGPEYVQEGIILVISREREILYQSPASRSWLQADSLQALYDQVLFRFSDDISIAKYEYQGEMGICVYQPYLIPYFFRQKSQKMVFYFILSLVTAAIIMGRLMLTSIQRTLRRLIEGTTAIANGDLTQPITLDKRNDFYALSRSFEKMRLDLIENRSREQRALMSVSHDLKTPLTSIRGYLEAIADGIIQEESEIREYAGMMLQKASILQQRIDELVEYSRYTTADWQDNWQTFAVQPWLDEMRSLYSTEASLCRRQFTAELDLPPDTLIRGDKRILSRSLDNLFDNACRYTDENDRIRLSARREGRELIIILEDSGSGIPEEKRQKIFEIFYRQDTGRNQRGMGIGLSSVRNIIEKHSGSVICEEGAWGGAAFRISLPLAVKSSGQESR